MKIRFNNFEVELEMEEMIEKEPEVTRTFLDMCIDSDRFADEEDFYRGQNVLPKNEENILSSLNGLFKEAIPGVEEIEFIIIEDDDNDDIDGALASLLG